MQIFEATRGYTYELMDHNTSHYILAIGSSRMDPASYVIMIRVCQHSPENLNCCSMIVKSNHVQV
jgi:hypothetical protein